MAIACTTAAQLPTDENDNWYWRTTKWGTQARAKRTNPAPFYRGYTIPSKGTEFTPYTLWNQQQLRYISRMWDHDPRVNQGDYDTFATSTQYTNAYGTLKYGNGFQLFLRNFLPWQKWNYLYYEYEYGHPLMGYVAAFLANAEPVFPGPAISSATWSLSGDISVPCHVALSGLYNSILLSVIPPPYNKAQAAQSIDLWGHYSAGINTPTVTVPNAWWRDALRGVEVGDQWGIQLREVPNATNSQNSTDPSFITVTIAA